MNIRTATVDDIDAIRATARRSFRQSYALSPQQLELLLDGRFSTTALERRLEADDRTVLVADPADEHDSDVALDGFTEHRTDGTLKWLHVHPESRGQGVGTELLERVEDELSDDSTSLRAELLGQASEGTQFLQRFDLEWAESGTTTVEGEAFDVQRFEHEGTDRAPNEPLVEIPDEVTIDGAPCVVDHADAVSGTQAPFVGVYESESFEERVGVVCSQCGTTDVLMDELDRLECTECGNDQRPDDWDSAYL